MNRKTERYCVNGHDTFISGRYSSRRCIACLREGTGEALRYLPAEPLRRRIRQEAAHHAGPNGDQGLAQLGRLYAERFGLTPEAGERQISRVLSKRSPRVTEMTADRWCALLGTHPVELWPEEWPLEVEA